MTSSGSKTNTTEKKKKKLENLAAERATLAGLCQFGIDGFVECDYLEIGHFTNEINQTLFKCINKVISEGSGKVDLASILSSANQLGVYEVINNENEISFLRSLFNFPSRKENIGLHASKLAKLKIARDLKQTIRACDGTLDNLKGDEDIAEIIAKVEEPIQDIVSKALLSDDDSIIRIGDSIEEYVEYLESNPVQQFGVDSGFSRYNKLIGGGFRRKCVDLVGARTKAGKSVFADNVAIYVASKNIPVLMIDTEMSREDHQHRLLANVSGIPMSEIETGKFANNEMKREKVKNAAKFLASIPYEYKTVAGQPIETILAVMKKFVKQKVGVDENGKTKDCLIIYDYFKLMDSGDINGSMQEYQVLGFQATKLHNFCVKYDVPCLSFIQLNRDGITKETSDVISQSDRIGWLCTSFSIFKMKSDEEFAEDGPENGNRKLITVLTRHGPGSQDGDYINFSMKGEVARIKEIGSRNEAKTNKSKTTKSQGFESDGDEDISDNK